MAAAGMEAAAMEAAKQAIKRGEYEDAHRHYSDALECNPKHIKAMMNRSMVCLKLGGHGRRLEALSDASEAVDLLVYQPVVDPVLLRRAYYRKGAALAALGRTAMAAESFFEAHRAVKTPDREVLQALRNLALGMEPVELAAVLSELIRQAEAPNPHGIALRDGGVLRGVPHEVRLAGKALQDHLLPALRLQGAIWNATVAEQWSRGRKLGRRELAVLRALAYLSLGTCLAAARDLPPLQAADGSPIPGNAALLLAERDARAAIAHSGGGKGGGKPWPEPHAVLALVLAACGGRAAEAALEMRRAFEMAPGREDLVEGLRHLCRALDPRERAAVMDEGSAGLERWMEEEKERRLPEYKRKRPKWYYYYEFMKDRLADQFPEGLPEPVMDKLLTMDASELDLLTCYPEAIKGQVREYVGVLENEGEAVLRTYQTKGMTWEEVKAAKNKP